jgi:GNAT superfamily N-acetyltransferase
MEGAIWMRGVLGSATKQALAQALPGACTVGVMDVKPLTKERWDRIVRVIDSWSGGLSRSLAHPIFFYELGEMARVVEEHDDLIGFLLGFIAPQSPPVGYVHLVGVHPDHRRRSIGRYLYSGFEVECRARGCKQAKAITTPGQRGVAALSPALSAGMPMRSLTTLAPACPALSSPRRFDQGSSGLRELVGGVAHFTGISVS